MLDNRLAMPPEHCRDCRLRCLPAFTPVTPQELSSIERLRSDTRSVRQGESIVAEHRDSGKLYTLYSGWAFRYVTMADGRRQILNFLLPGDLVGLQAQFVDDATHGVEAMTDASLCVFPRDRLWELFQQQPRMAYDLTWLCASEERLVDENLVSVGQRSAAERIAMLLINLWRRAERVGLIDAAGGAMFPLTQQHIADALGLSLVHTNKTLRKLERMGLHGIRDERLHLVDTAALQRLADYYTRPLRAVPLL